MILDRHGALKRLGGDEGLFADLAKVFCEDAPPLLDRLLAAVEANDIQGTHRAAHALRGLASNFGADSLIQSLQKLEERSLQGELHHGAELVDDAREKTRQLQAELAEYCP